MIPKAFKIFFLQISKLQIAPEVLVDHQDLKWDGIVRYIWEN